jgi:hypothetical protein
MFEIDMTNVANHVVFAGPGNLTVSSTSDTNFAEVTKINNYPRDVQGSARISW